MKFLNIKLYESKLEPETVKAFRCKMLLYNNQISTLAENAFAGLESLKELWLQSNQISTLAANAFAGLESLKDLYLQDNNITTIDQGAFSVFASSLGKLDIRRNNLQVYRESTFEELKYITELYSDLFRLCCLVGEIEVCEPTDAFASCADLLKREVLRILMLVIGLSSLIGNFIVIISRRINKENRSTVDSILLTNLAASDLLMAIYLLIIAGADIHYRGRYAKVASEWKNSFLCSFSGAISTLSGQCSVSTLMLMSINRAINIIYPFSTERLKRTKCKIIIGIAWLVWLVISFLPLVANKSHVGIPYFGENYYGKQSVCLALPLTRHRLPGWEYATAIFIAFNGLGFFVIAASYLTILLSVKRSAITANRMQRREEEIEMAVKLGFIVFTDFCCWFPIIVMGICSEMEWWRIPDDIYVWAATFIIPINSSVNPYLYTIIYMCKTERRP
ncbi:G-protein coupled receptor GRL101-like [Antedon mediterranea]|uniref:G-protein coupled receptor GRL101-like n=1 Tax=Antedon mediterranea TaxID=105859 RepID=UPI003AF7E845